MNTYHTTKILETLFKYLIQQGVKFEDFVKEAKRVWDKVKSEHKTNGT